MLLGTVSPLDAENLLDHEGLIRHYRAESDLPRNQVAEGFNVEHARGSWQTGFNIF